MPFCGKCGQEVEFGNVFCGSCGAMLPLSNVVADFDEDEDALEDEEVLEEEGLDDEEASEEGELGEEEDLKEEIDMDEELVSAPGPDDKGKPDSDVEEKIKDKGAQDTRRDPQETRVRRCPACGEIVGEYAYTCESCGFELRRSSDGSIAELYRKLEEIENSRPKSKKEDDSGNTPTDKKLASAIRNFPIPNTKEDLIEFLVMANANSRWDDRDAEEEAVPCAWRSKFDQAYTKAELLFGQDASFERFQKIKSQAKASEREGVRKNFLAWVGVGVSLVFAIGAAVLFLSLSDCGLKSENTRLQGVLSQVYECIDDGEYGKARQEAAGLVYSGNTVSSSGADAAEHWEEIRKETLELIDQKERGE